MNSPSDDETPRLSFEREPPTWTPDGETDAAAQAEHPQASRKPESSPFSINREDGPGEGGDVLNAPPTATHRSVPRWSEPLSWIVIAATALFVVVSVQIEQGQREELVEIQSGSEIAMQARVAAAQFEREGEANVLEAMEPLAQTPASTRRVAATFAALDRGDGERIARARELMSRIPGQRQELADGEVPAPGDLDPLLIRAFESPNGLSDAEVARIEEALGWPGELLVVRDLADDDPRRLAVYNDASRRASRSAIMVFGFMIGLAVGVVLLAMAWGRIRERRWQNALEPSRADARIYLESFALYIGLISLGDIIALVLGIDLVATSLLLAIGGSMMAFVWPLVRGVSWAALRRDLGLHRGAGWFSELRAGVIGYLAILPLFATGVVMMLVLTAMTDALGMDNATLHPDMVGIESAGTLQQSIVVFFAVFFAPFFEELTFRGALLRALRRRYRVLASLALMSLLFAMIHPQGLLAVPPLAMLALGFGALREWRSSLIAPMVAHGLHNGILVAVTLLVFG